MPTHARGKTWSDRRSWAGGQAPQPWQDPGLLAHPDLTCFQVSLAPQGPGCFLESVVLFPAHQAVWVPCQSVLRGPERDRLSGREALGRLQAIPGMPGPAPQLLSAELLTWNFPVCRTPPPPPRSSHPYWASRDSALKLQARLGVVGGSPSKGARPSSHAALAYQEGL